MIKIEMIIIEKIDQLPLDILLYIITYIDNKILLSVCSISHRFIGLNLESLLRQRLTQLTRLNLKNHNLKRLINLTKFPFNRNRINANGCHSIILDNDGQIYIFGNNNQGQLGLGNNISINTPTLIVDIYGSIAASVGIAHSMILNNCDKIYTFGDNYFGQLGLGNNIDKNTPTLISDMDKIIAISAGEYHSIVLDNDGQIYTFGRNNFGQLGLGDNTPKNTPTFIANIA